jgi:hypothetical protein
VKPVLDSIVDTNLKAVFSSSVNEFLQHSVFGSHPAASMSAIIDSSQVFKQISEYVFNLSRFILQAELGDNSACKVISRSESSVVLSTMDSSYIIKRNRLYRGSENGFSAAAFHRLCDNQGPTVVLIKANNGRVAAGYSCVSWKSGYTSDANPRGFLCSIDENNLTLQMFKGVPATCMVWLSANYGPIFTNGLCIFDKCDKNLSSHSTLGGGFEGNGDQFALFGLKSLAVVEYEVFGIEFVV